MHDFRLVPIQSKEGKETLSATRSVEPPTGGTQVGKRQFLGQDASGALAKAGKMGIISGDG